MQIIEAINGIDILKPNTYTQEQKVAWLKTLDGNIREQLGKTHEGNMPEINYDDLCAELLIPFPFDETYLHYLAMKIDFANGDFKKYNNNATAYEASLTEYKKWYNREHLPKRVTSLVF